MALIKLPLGKFFEGAASPIVKRVMASLGLGVVSFAAITTALTSAITMARGYYTGLPEYIFALAGLGGIGEGMGIIAGALVFRAAFSSMSKIGVLS